MLSLFLLLALVPAALADGLHCLGSIPDRVLRRPVGVETIHKVPGTTITIFLPMPKTTDGSVLDLNALDYNDAYPEKFFLSDGTLRTAFLSVDLGRRSKLSQCVNEMAADIKAQASTDEEKLNLLKTYLYGRMQPVPDGHKFPWDPEREPKNPPREFKAAADLEPGHFPLKTKLQQPVVALERFLKEGYGLCVQRVLLSSFILKKLGIGHRVRAGGTSQSGHMWIELADGRILDPTWSLLEAPSPDTDNWFRLDQSTLFTNQFFPFTVD